MSLPPGYQPNPDRLHQWILLAAYAVTEDDIKAGVIKLTAADRKSVDGPACANCDVRYEEAPPTCPRGWYVLGSGEAMAGETTERVDSPSQFTVGITVVAPSGPVVLPAKCLSCGMGETTEGRDAFLAHSCDVFREAPEAEQAANAAAHSRLAGALIDGAQRRESGLSDA